MKCRKWMYMTMMLFVLLTISAIAQDNQNPGPKHHHYQLIDPGTFGGPQSFQWAPGLFRAGVLNNQGTLAGFSDTSAVDPYCFWSADC